MKKRSKIWAILGASVLTLGVVTIALAIELKDAHQGITVSWDENGDPVITGFDGADSTECPDVPGPGEVIFHFVQSGNDVAPNAGGEAGNTIDVDFDDESDVTGAAADDVKEHNVDWFVSVDASDGSVTLVTANSNVSGGELRVSHICVGDEPGDEETPPPSFEESEAGETDVPTDEPSFEESQEGETDAPSEPHTNTLGGNGTSAPADGAWLLVVALGVLLGSIVVLTPARAKSRR